MVDDGVRALRLAVFSIAATVLALGAHVLGGGEPPALLTTGAAVLLPAAAAVALSRRRRRLVEIVVVLGAVQLLLHEIFAAGPSAGPGHSGHVGHVGHSPHPWMPVTHVLAVLLTGLLLAHGERVLGLLLTWWRSVPTVWRAHVVPVVVARRPVLPVAVRVRPAPPSLRACAPVVRRGPPGCFC